VRFRSHGLGMGAGSRYKQPMTDSPLVSTEWLAANINRDDVAVVDASWYLPTMNRDGKAEYAQRHIPKAVHFDIDAVKDETSPLPHMLPTPDVFAKAVGAMGISDDMTIVVYDGAGLFAAPRVRWTFKVMGAKDVRVLDGGLPKWLAEGRSVVQGTPTPEAKVFNATVQANAVADLAAIKEALHSQSAQVVDARPAPRFKGDMPEPRPGLAAGHMPGSHNLPFDVVVRDGRLLAPNTIRAAFLSAGVDIDQPVITTCGSGVSAAILSLAMETAGAEAKALYDGSWAEWGGRADCPVATSKSG
jgi:thiosulfate/3-mercaptopyruvate sulfurtransferase